MTWAESFVRPEAWPILLLAPLAAVALWRLDRAKTRRRERVLGPRARVLVPRLDRGRWRRTLVVAAVFLASVAILQPMWGESTHTEEQRGVDILVCLDVSRSMLARDLPPGRLDRAKQEIRRLAESVRGDRLGLVVFAGEARLTVPLTQDRASFADLADLADPHVVGRGGTDLGEALTAALEALAGATGDHEVVILVTDGEDHAGRGLAVARMCAEKNITVHCVGLGSPRGAKIAIEDEGGEAFLRDRAGAEVISTMDPASLRRIAETTGGKFVDGGEQDQALVGLYEDRIVPMARKAFMAVERRERENRFQWTLLPAFLLWMLSVFVKDGWRHRRSGRTVR
jgi:Ca-activated chloride channel homolog